MSKRTQIIAMVIVASIGLMIYGLITIQGSERQSLRARFQTRVQLTGTLIDALVNSSLSPTQQISLTKMFGGHQINQAQLQNRLNGMAYIAVLDANGRILGHIGQVPSRAINEAKEALAKGVVIGNVVDKVTPVALTFPGEGGRRILLQGQPYQVLDQFFGPLLKKVQDKNGQGRGSILDDNGFLLTGVNVKTKVGTYISPASLQLIRSHPSGESKTGNYYASVRIATHLHIFLAQPLSTLYAPVSGINFWLPWVILTMMVVGSTASVVLLSRVEVREHRLSVLRSRLERVNDDIIKANSDLSSFAGVAAHDIRGPLRKISSFIDLVVETQGPNLDATGQDYLRRIKNNASQLDRLTNDLVLYTRAGTEDTKLGTVDLNVVVRDVKTLLAADITQSKARLNIAPLPKIKGNHGAMVHVFQNLVANSIKFVEPGAIPKIDIWESVVDSSKITIFLRDYGIGIPEEYRERVFQPFERLHPNKEYEGSGIGLALCRRILTKHGGTIKALGPKTGPGTLIEITLPNYDSNA